jgi:hypothetical protein
MFEESANLNFQAKLCTEESWRSEVWLYIWAAREVGVFI